MPDESAIVMLRDGNGNEYACQILDIFDFLERQYALLLKQNDESLVIMRMISRDEGSVFQVIEDNDEFDQVVAHVQALARESNRPQDGGLGIDLGQ
jgi:uncharacterized protein YrzB (UPF0473 family)